MCGVRIAVRSILCLTVLSSGSPAAEPSASNPQAPVKDWPAEVRVIQYRSSADGAQQPALWYQPARDEPVPLLVALHTWSGNYLQAQPGYAMWCIKKGWAMVHPDFRGPNSRPEACGSELVVQDILSAVAEAQRRTRVDAKRIYLMGGSGGGYASLLMAGRSPDIWAGVSAWCGIYDLSAWHAEAKQRGLRYAQMVEKCCGGAPGDGAAVDEQYRVRSASNTMAAAKNVPLDINHGIADGHRGSVPVSHSLRAFNALAAPGDRIPESDIAALLEKPEVPARLLQTIDDPLYQRGKVVYRRVSGNTRVTLFQGGHEILYAVGLNWLEQQRKGEPAKWSVQPSADVDLSKAKTASGK
jgi:dipeptidyl aminopeptidase/acylaminoacyl peptidase